jgi:hypothetical protein
MRDSKKEKETGVGFTRFQVYSKLLQNKNSTPFNSEVVKWNQLGSVRDKNFVADKSLFLFNSRQTECEKTLTFSSKRQSRERRKEGKEDITHT